MTGCVRAWAIVLAVGVVLVACGGGSGDIDPEGTAAASLEVTSEAFEEGATIPERFTCDGQDVVPPLSWSDLPGGTEQVAVAVTDPDAPGGTFVHWLAVLPPDGRTDEPVTEGTNDFGDTGYGGPCPPEGDEPHRYVFTVYASGVGLGLDPGFSAADLESALGEDLQAEGRLTARYGR